MLNVVISIFSCLITRQLKMKICEGRIGKRHCGLAWPTMSPPWSSNRELVHLSVAALVKNTRLSPDWWKDEKHGIRTLAPTRLKNTTQHYHHPYIWQHQRHIPTILQSCRRGLFNFFKAQLWPIRIWARLIVLNMSLFTDVVLHSGD